MINGCKICSYFITIRDTCGVCFCTKILVKATYNFPLAFTLIRSYNAHMDTNEIINSLRAENRRKFPKEIFATERVDVVGHMERLLSDRGVTVAELVPSMCYERSYIYHMMNGSRAPSRTFLLRLAIVLKLSYEETQRLLFITENPLLFARVEFDAVIIYALERHMGASEVNDLLSEVGEKPLFWTQE